MNNLYSSVVHADVSREDSKNIRDQYVNQLAPKLQQVAGLDLSLQQNVDTAKALFTPFYENEKLVRDIVFTKKYKSEMTKAQSMKESNDEKTRKQYWDDGIKKLQYDMEDFVGASSQDMMSTALPQYVSQYDIMGEGLAKIKELDPNVQNVSFSEDGYWKITMKNGSLLTRQPIGENKAGEMQYSNPMGDFLSATLLNDPRAIDYYRTKSYVEARSFYDKDKEQYGNKQAGMNAWADQFIQQYGTEEEKTIAALEKKERSLKGRTIGWENSVKENGLTEGSDTDQAIKDANAEHQVTKRSKDIRKERSRQINEGPSDNLTKAFSMFMSFNMMNDINETANTYASTHGEVDMDVNPYRVEDVKQANRINLENLKQRNRQSMEIMKWEMDNLPTQEGQGGNASQLGWEAGHFNSSMLTPGWDESMSTRNNAELDKQLKDDDLYKLNLVEQWFIQKNANQGATALDNIEFWQESEGREVDGVAQGGEWEEQVQTTFGEIRKELDNGNSDLLESAYQNMKAEYDLLVEDNNSSPMGHTDGDLLYNVQNGINYLTAREFEHTEGQRLQTEAYEALEDFVMAEDKGDFGELVEEVKAKYGTDLGLFRSNEDGPTSMLSEPEFIDAFVNATRFDSYTQEGALQMQELGLGLNGQLRPVMGVDFAPTQERFTTVENNISSNNSAVEASNPLGNLANYVRGQQKPDTSSRTVSVNDETARQKAKETYDGLLVEMNEVAKKATGETVAMPGFDLSTFYDLKGQSGVGDLATPWTGGVYDHFEQPQNNSGQLQTDQLLQLILNERGDMVVKYNTSDELAGVLNTVKGDDGAQGDLNTFFTHMRLSDDAEGKKESRPQFTIRYNPNGPVRNAGEDDAERYSVYEIMLDPTYAKSYGQLSEGDAGERTTKFQDNNYTLSVYVPKGNYPNSADDGSAKHMWQRMLNSGESGSNPTVSHPAAGSIEISMVGEQYYATINHKTYDPINHVWKDEFTNVKKLTNVTDYDQFEYLKQTFEQQMMDRAAANMAAMKKDNEDNK
jgi:hypothetical protein